MDPVAAKQQIVERVRQATNILVTVSNNPSVDQLASCIGLTILLNKMQKHATAVFSGQVPSTLEFLQPERTIETNTDSLRDFIISLDKEKADKLRYKVEDQVVKIFITPYRTSLTEKDLVFSQGDFNVEVVIALGIKDRNQIDAAIANHGRILHDATVISLNSGQGKAPDLGQINWQDTAASSLSEMLVSISEAFGGGLIDAQIATAFLTGIVAETQRFSNTKTTPKVMTMSAQLMAAGANQQLIVSKLDQQTQVAIPKAATPKPVEETVEPGEDGTLTVAHDLEAKLKESEKKAEKAKATESDEIHIDEEGNLKTAGDLIKPIEPEHKEEDDGGGDQDQGPKSPLEAVTSGAATEEPAEPEVKDEAQTDESELPGSHTILNPAQKHPFLESPLTANTVPEWQDPYDSVPIDPLAGNGPGDEHVFEHKTVVKPLSEQTAAKPATEVGQTAEQPAQPQPSGADLDQARSAVESALSRAPFNPASDPIESLGATDLAEPAPTPTEKPVAKPEPNGTPSLPLPGADSPTQPAKADSGAEPDSTGGAAPPPVPPPFMPMSTPPFGNQAS